MLYMIRALPACIFYPLLCLWSLLYGVIAGVVFKVAAAIENWWAINRLQLILWKRYPQRSYRKYIDSLWAMHSRGRPIELADYTRNKLEERYPAEPFPFLRLLLNTLMTLCIIPFMVLSGLVEGPAHVFRQHAALRRQQERSLPEQASL